MKKVIHIDKKYCKGNFVQIPSESDCVEFIITAEEILFFKIGPKILVNKYENHPNKIFPTLIEKLSDWKTTGYPIFPEIFYPIYEKKKNYLHYKGSIAGVSLQKEFIFPGTEGALFYQEEIKIEDSFLSENAIKTEIFSRKQLEQKLNFEHYEAMYFLNLYFDEPVSWASNLKDGCILSEPLLPSDEEIINLEWQLRKFQSSFDFSKNKSAPPTAKEKKIEPKLIEEITDFPIYAPILEEVFSSLFIIVQNGIFHIEPFNLEFQKKDTFVFTSHEEILSTPTMNDIIEHPHVHEFITDLEIKKEKNPQKIRERKKRVLPIFK